MYINHKISKIRSLNITKVYYPYAHMPRSFEERNVKIDYKFYKYEREQQTSLKMYETSSTFLRSHQLCRIELIIVIYGS